MENRSRSGVIIIVVATVLGIILGLGIGTTTDPLEQEARRLIDQGKVADGQAKLDEALEADEKAAVEAKRLEAERGKAGAQKARNLAVWCAAPMLSRPFRITNGRLGCGDAGTSLKR